MFSFATHNQILSRIANQVYEAVQQLVVTHYDFNATPPCAVFTVQQVQEAIRAINPTLHARTSWSGVQAKMQHDGWNASDWNDDPAATLTCTMAQSSGQLFAECMLDMLKEDDDIVLVRRGDGKDVLSATPGKRATAPGEPMQTVLVKKARSESAGQDL